MLDTFGKRFRHMREELGLKQKDLLEKFNKNYHYNFTMAAISQYENDKRMPELDALKAFSDFFNVSVDWLLCRTNNPNPNTDEIDAVREYRQLIKELGIEEIQALKEIKKEGHSLVDINNALKTLRAKKS